MRDQHSDYRHEDHEDLEADAAAVEQENVEALMNDAPARMTNVEMHDDAVGRREGGPADAEDNAAALEIMEDEMDALQM